jgi:hypothetical protein
MSFNGPFFIDSHIEKEGKGTLSEFEKSYLNWNRLEKNFNCGKRGKNEKNTFFVAKKSYKVAQKHNFILFKASD